MSQIDPLISQLYFWEAVDFSNHIDIHILLPNNFHSETLKTDIIDNQYIICSLPNSPPIVAGKLFDDIKKVNTYVENGSTFVISMEKVRQSQWGIIVVGPMRNDNIIDPQSAYVLGKLTIDSINNNSVPQDQIQEQYTNANALMNLSASTKFPPALLYLYDCINGQDPELSMRFLEIAAIEYHYPGAILRLAFLSFQKNDMDKALHFFQEAYNYGIIEGLNGVGEILSPLSGIEYHSKDPFKAFNCFKECIEKAEGFAYPHLNISKMYAYGIGTGKNIEKAIYHRNRALELNSEIESFEIDESIITKPKIRYTLYMAIGVGALAALAGYLIYRKKSLKEKQQ